MRVEAKLFGGAGLFFMVTGGFYWLTSYESAGTTLLGLSVGALLLIGAYLLVQGRRSGLRPEDVQEADPGDSPGEVGYFPSSSVWPFVTALAVAILGTSLVYGVWPAITGGILLVTAVIGFALEAESKA